MPTVTEAVITKIVAVHNVLTQENDLSPRNQRINVALGRLVEMLTRKYTATQIAAIVGDERVTCRREMLLARLSEAETALEMFWAERFTAMQELRLTNLAEFTYWTNYRRLVGNELRTLAQSRACCSRMVPHSACGGECGRSIAFVGAGPLPLSAILLHLRTGMRVHCVDIDAAACELASALLHRLSLTDMRVIHADGGTLEYDGVPVTFVASLVPNKERVIRRIRARNANAVVALRSAEGLSTLLYEPVDENMLEASSFCVSAQTHPDRKTINTTLFCVPIPLVAARTCDQVLSSNQCTFPGE